MVNATIERELHEQLDQLPSGHQRQVLEYARALASGRRIGVPGNSLLSLAGTIAPEDLDLMIRAIHEDCEQVDKDDW